jgi:hypothetical protein
MLPYGEARRGEASPMPLCTLRRIRLASMAWAEVVPSLVIVTVAVASMGLLQGVFHRLATGERRRVGQDRWDRLLYERDRRLEAERVGK